MRLEDTERPVGLGINYGLRVLEGLRRRQSYCQGVAVPMFETFTSRISAFRCFAAEPTGFEFASRNLEPKAIGSSELEIPHCC